MCYAALYLAIPLIISMVTTPLLGLVDTIVIGHLESAYYIGGVAIGVTIFNTLYWLFGFLRASTIGLVAQSAGKEDVREMQLSFYRPFIIALGTGVFFVAIQYFIFNGAMFFIRPEEEVIYYAKQYFYIRIWGAPFALMMYVILGWLVGMKKVKVSLVLQVYMNVLNIALCILFVVLLKWDVKGVAFATVICEISAPILGLLYFKWKKALQWTRAYKEQLLDANVLKKMLRMNRDFFIRTICLVTTFTLFTSLSSKLGVGILAANTILFQIHLIFAYIFDGLANASSILIGNAKGKKDLAFYQQTMKLSWRWNLGISFVLGLFFLLFDEKLLRYFTNIDEVLTLAVEYSFWIAIYPLVGFWGLILNGVFTGATDIAPIRNSLVYALLLFLVVTWLFMPNWQNNGLWLAFTLFSFGRSVFLGMYTGKLKRSFIE